MKTNEAHFQSNIHSYFFALGLNTINEFETKIVRIDTSTVLVVLTCAGIEYLSKPFAFKNTKLLYILFII